MADETKKNGEYEKPESHGTEGDELEGVSGGTEGSGPGYCQDGGGEAVRCKNGSHAGSHCVQGDYAGSRGCSGGNRG